MKEKYETLVFMGYAIWFSNDFAMILLGKYVLAIPVKTFENISVSEIESLHDQARLNVEKHKHDNIHQAYAAIRVECIDFLLKSDESVQFLNEYKSEILLLKSIVGFEERISVLEDKVIDAVIKKRNDFTCYDILNKYGYQLSKLQELIKQEKNNV